MGALNATEIRERQKPAACDRFFRRPSRAVCMLRQIEMAGNALGAGFTKTIRLR
jgi:hypothetical protein